ncbi:hypothetical protein, partial [Dietzia sp. CQ4]|uniref:hypothetical protein n=1 Tax=Dietzia sp. (strain CQ4) TaxID=370437 RepID=UPI0019D4F10D
MTISLEDITGVPAQDGDVVWVSSPVRRSAGGRTLMPREQPVDLVAGEGSVEVHPGPLQVRFDLAGVTFREGPTARVVVPEGEGEESLAEMLSAAHDWTPEEMSEFARLRNEAVDAAQRAEGAAGAVDEAITDAAGQVVAAVEDDRVRAETARGVAEDAAEDTKGYRDEAGGHAGTAGVERAAS